MFVPIKISSSVDFAASLTLNARGEEVALGDLALPFESIDVDVESHAEPVQSFPHSESAGIIKLVKAYHLPRTPFPSESLSVLF